jgi:hypothetical protein
MNEIAATTATATTAAARPPPPTATTTTRKPTEKARGKLQAREERALREHRREEKGLVVAYNGASILGSSQLII